MGVGQSQCTEWVELGGETREFGEGRKGRAKENRGVLCKEQWKTDEFTPHTFIKQKKRKSNGLMILNVSGKN